MKFHEETSDVTALSSEALGRELTTMLAEAKALVERANTTRFSKREAKQVLARANYYQTRAGALEAEVRRRRTTD